jgi:hypothetical protein
MINLTGFTPIKYPIYPLKTALHNKNASMSIGKKAFDLTDIVKDDVV